MDIFNCGDLDVETGLRDFCDQVSSSTFATFFILCIIFCLFSLLSSSLLVMMRQQGGQFKSREAFKNYPGNTRH